MTGADLSRSGEGRSGPPTGTGLDPVSGPDGASQRAGIASKLNWLRAGVLGADDGIVSIAGLVVGVAGASATRSVVLAAGMAGLVAGAVSMALGEYVSVSSQRDTERSLLAQERRELAEAPELELAELASLYRAKGLSEETAQRVAEELTACCAYRAHVDAELGIDPDALTNPWNAALASAISFSVGALFPLAAILLPPVAIRVPVTFGVVVVALALTAVLSARLGSASRLRAVARMVGGGTLAMAVTFGIGHLVGVGI
jgi:VIT1/CCC1 family predicted Fe2+/Mn2+ transporter